MKSIVRKNERTVMREQDEERNAEQKGKRADENKSRRKNRKWNVVLKSAERGQRGGIRETKNSR